MSGKKIVSESSDTITVVTGEQIPKGAIFVDPAYVHYRLPRGSQFAGINGVTGLTS